MAVPQPAGPVVFIVRLWVEKTAGGAHTRGYVEHVASGDRRYFVDVAEAADFIAAIGARHSGGARPLPGSIDRREDMDALPG